MLELVVAFRKRVRPLGSGCRRFQQTLSLRSAWNTLLTGCIVTMPCCRPNKVLEIRRLILLFCDLVLFIKDLLLHQVVEVIRLLHLIQHILGQGAEVAEVQQLVGAQF